MWWAEAHLSHGGVRHQNLPMLLHLAKVVDQTIKSP